MRWPWQRKPEARASNYTDAIVSALLAGADGGGATASATSALEACAALYAAGFAAAKVEGSAVVQSLLKPQCMALIARNMIRMGEDVHVIDVDMNGIRISPAGSWDIQGDHRPENWRVRADLFGPSGSLSRYLPYQAVVHCRYSVDSARPWHGMGPLQWAASTGTLAGNIERLLSQESGAPSAQLLPVPVDGGDGGENDTVQTLKTGLANAKGKSVLVETTAGGWGEGAASTPRKDWMQTRIGPDWPDVVAKTRESVQVAVYAACNVPAVLLAMKSEGTSQREGLRRFAHLGLEPMARLIEAEITLKLDEPVRIDFSPLMASDLAGKARAIKGMVDAGISLEKSLEIAGVD